MNIDKTSGPIRTIVTSITGCILLFSPFLISCGTKNKDSALASSNLKHFIPASPLKLADVPNLSQSVAVIRDDLKARFCISSYRLPLKVDFSSELGILCRDHKPIKAFDDLDRYAGIVGSAPRSVELSIEHKGEFTEGFFATIYRIPIAPKWVQKGQIASYMVGASDVQYVTLDGTVEKEIREGLGGDLQFGQWNLYYHTHVFAPDGHEFDNQRRTQVDGYQVEGGNSDIGMGAEHLVDSNNQDYRTYNTMTVTIGNKDGSSSLLTVIHVEIRNNGYPDLAEKIMSDIAHAQATHVHDGLSRELQVGVLPGL